MNNCQFKEIVLFENFFEAEDGVFGLGRDVYLSIVKFLDLSVVLKKNLKKKTNLNYYLI
jgi:hypothetical protein